LTLELLTYFKQEFKMNQDLIDETNRNAFNFLKKNTQKPSFRDQISFRIKEMVLRYNQLDLELSKQ